MLDGIINFYYVRTPGNTQSGQFALNLCLRQFSCKMRFARDKHYVHLKVIFMALVKQVKYTFGPHTVHQTNCQCQ